ncbi:DUF3331 domain-containing protein [Cupriavidus sp. CP313]
MFPVETCGTAATSLDFASQKPRLPHVVPLPDGQTTNATVSLVERHSTGTVVLSWRDATGSCYGNQSWRKGRAKMNGKCAVCGKRIVCGDLVFRPTLGSSRPGNASAMILAKCLESLLPDSETSGGSCRHPRGASS